MSEYEFKVGDIVESVKTDTTGGLDSFAYGLVYEMFPFIEGKVKGTVVDIEDDFLESDGAIRVQIETDQEPRRFYFGASELKLAKKQKTPTKAAIRTQKVLAKAPKKVYAVLKGDRVFTAKTREDARERKAKLGGKAAGAVIVAYTPAEEIR